MKPRRALLLTLSFVGLIHASSVASQTNEQPVSPPSPENKLAPLLAEHRDLLKRYGLAPIIVSRGERVGDTFDPNTLILLAGADDCFPKLKPRRSPAQLPTISGESARGLAAALGVAGIIDAGGAGSTNRSFELSFEDVEAVTASVVQLRSALRRGVPECDRLAPYLAAVNTGGIQAIVEKEVKRPPETEPPLLIGTLYLARRVVQVSTIDQAGAKAEASFFEDLLRRAGLASSFEVSVQASQANQSKAELKSKHIIPAAFGTAFIKARIGVVDTNGSRVVGDETGSSAVRRNLVITPIEPETTDIKIEDTRTIIPGHINSLKKIGTQEIEDMFKEGEILLTLPINERKYIKNILPSEVLLEMNQNTNFHANLSRIGLQKAFK